MLILNVTWNRNDGLPSALTELISSGFSGFSLNHSDIGKISLGNNGI